jgi:hypothetical protein
VLFQGADQELLAGRYRLAPQLREYDRNEPYLRPYLTFTAQPDLRSPVFNTDAEGFRISSSPVGPIDTARWLELGSGGLVLGGSVTFGHGATCDAATMPSRLAGLLGSPQLNLGVCAANSLQELIAALPFLERAETVVLCSGANSVLASLQSLGLNETFEPLFFESALAGLATAPIVDVLQMVTAAQGGARPRVRSEPLRPARPAPGAMRAADLPARLDAALARIVRSLRILSLARRPGARVVFCLQPFAGAGLRELAPEERELFALNARQQRAWATLRDYVTASWGRCADRLGRACATLGVQFLDLSAHRFRGWSFLDLVHMTDLGYRQAAELIEEALRCGA